MNALSRQTAMHASGAVHADDVWLPRLLQEERLRRLDDQIASGRASIETEVERAALLHALDRRTEARHAFIQILLRAPTHFAALNEFGGILTSAGFVAAACRVYSEAISHHPDNPTGHVNLANLLLRGSNLADARKHYEAALRLDPDHPQAHQGLGAVFAEMGDRRLARSHFLKGFGGHAVAPLPYRGTEKPISVLLLVSSGGGNIPAAPILDDRIFMTTVVVADFFPPAEALPPHDVIFNSIGDADACRPALAAAARLVARTNAPVVNSPSAVLKTGRAANAARLRAIPGVVSPRTLRLPRAAFAGGRADEAIADHGFAFPLLLRSPGFHTGRNFVRVATASELAGAADKLPGHELLAIEYLDARGQDGKSRKYRVMIVDGRLYPLHLAISRDWKVHYFTSDMADHADYRMEEAAFLDDMAGVLGVRAMRALQGIRAELGLDYGGIDFGLGADGDVLAFEANATMIIAPPDPHERWNYRRAAASAIVDAVRDMIVGKSGRTKHGAARDGFGGDDLLMPVRPRQRSIPDLTAAP